MRQRRLIPPPERATAADLYRFVLGGLMLLLGTVILARTLSLGIVTPPALLMSTAFIAFGAYRLYVGIVRYRLYRASSRQTYRGS